LIYQAKKNSNISPLTTALSAGDGSLNHNITISDTPLPLAMAASSYMAALSYGSP